MDFEFLKQNFPNYTLAMYEGREPQNKRASVDNDWFYNYQDYLHSCCCEVYKNNVVFGEISLGDYTIFLNDYRYCNQWYILDILYNTGEGYWVYHNKDGACHLNWNVTKKKPYVAEAKLRRILNTKIDKLTFSPKAIMDKARELFELGDWKGEYRDM